MQTSWRPGGTRPPEEGPGTRVPGPLWAVVANHKHPRSLLRPHKPGGALVHHSCYTTLWGGRAGRPCYGGNYAVS
jgi:hypothetical protein